jgi:hypothetical protein
VLGEDLIEAAADVDISLAWISMSVAWPWKLEETWWMRILELGSDMRLPAAPPAKSRAPMLIAIPTQIVCTSGLMKNCIVS